MIDNPYEHTCTKFLKKKKELECLKEIICDPIYTAPTTWVARIIINYENGVH